MFFLDDGEHVPGTAAQESMDQWLRVRAVSARGIPPPDMERFMPDSAWSSGFGKQGGTADAITAFVPAFGADAFLMPKARQAGQR